jgi:hypothetical protein
LEGNGFLKPERLLELRRRRVPTSLGQDVLVRALGYADLSSMMGALLDVASLGDEAKGRPADLVNSPKGLSLLGSIEKVVVAACLEPVFGTDPTAGPVASDLPLEDQMAIFTVVCELSGYSKKTAEQVRP